MLLLYILCIIYLVSPFDDDTLDSILQLDITLPARRGTGLALLFINILCSLQWTQVQCGDILCSCNKKRI